MNQLKWVAVGFALAFIVLLTFATAYQTEVVYDRYGVKVILQQSREGSEDVLVVLKRGGRSLEHAVFIYAPGEREWLYLGNGSHRRTVPLGRFVAEGQRLINKLGYRGVKGVKVELGLVIFAQVFNVTERGGRKILEVYTDIFAVPLNPTEVRGKRVVVEREFTPVYKIEQPLDEDASQQIGPQIRSPGTPPMGMSPCYDPRYPKQFEYCYFGGAYSYCYYWALASSTFVDTVIAPLATVYLDNAAGPKTQRMQIDTWIYLSSSTTTSLSFDVAVGLSGLRLSLATGISFTLSDTSKSMEFISATGYVYNSRYDSTPARLWDYIRGGYGPVYPGDKLYDDGVVYVGILGELRYTKWAYVYNRYDGSSCQVQDLNYADGIAFYPWGDPSYNGAFYPYLVIDDTPFALKETKALLAAMSAPNTAWKSLPQVTGRDYSIRQSNVVEAASTLDISLTSIPLAYVATTSGSGSLSLDFGLPINVRLSTSAKSTTVTYIQFTLTGYKDGLKWSGGALSIGNVKTYLDPYGNTILTNQWLAVQLIKPTVSE